MPTHMSASGPLFTDTMKGHRRRARERRQVTMKNEAGAGATHERYKVGYLIGSLSTQSINRRPAMALTRLAPKNLDFG